MRRLFTTAELFGRGRTEAELRWGLQKARWVRVVRSVYAEGPAPPSLLDRQRARVLASGGVASGALTGVLLGLDSVVLDDRPMRRRPVDEVIEVGGVRSVTAARALLDLAGTMDTDTWEQVLESALRKRLTSIEVIEDALAAGKVTGAPMIRFVLDRRGPGTPPTESLLETLTVQLARGVPGLDDLTRQHQVFDHDGLFVARVDLCEPELGVFFELDGQHHQGQPVYDAMRETAVVAATGWLCGRFTWYEVVRVPRSTRRRLAGVAHQARRRPVAS